MAIYRIQPLPDGVTQRGSWQVLRNGVQVSAHTKKSAAKRSARRRAGSGDEVILHRTDGTVMG